MQRSGKIRAVHHSKSADGNEDALKMSQNMQDTTASAVFRQLRAVPSDTAAHAAQLDLVGRLVGGELELHLPRKARARALLEWAAGRCAVKEGPNTPSAPLDPTYWRLFARILSLKDDSSPSGSNSSFLPDEASNLLSKSDIRQIVLLSRGTTLLNALKLCLDSLPSLLADAGATPAGSTASSTIGPDEAKNLLQNLSKVFEILFPLSLSSPTTTLDGLLPCIHAFIHSSGSLASGAPSTTPVLANWNTLGHLLLHTLSSLVKATSPSQETSANDKLLLRKVAGSFLDQASGCNNWNAFTASYSAVLKMNANEIPDSIREKGKGKARDTHDAHQRPSLDTSLASGSTFAAEQDDVSSLLALLHSFMSTAIFSQGNLARYFSIASGASLETPKQAQEALSEPLNTLKTSIRSCTASQAANQSLSILAVLPPMMASYIQTLSSNSHDLFAPSRRARNAGDAAGDNAAMGSRSAVEYQVQTCLRNAIFGMLQGLIHLLRDVTPGQSASSKAMSASPRKRLREAPEHANVELTRAIAGAFKLLLAQIERRNIYISGGATSNQDWLTILRDAARFAAEEFLPAAGRAVSPEADTVLWGMQAVTSIAKMDATAVEVVLPSLLQAMTPVPSQHGKPFSAACNELLDCALVYNGKVRQLNTLLGQVGKSISVVIDHSAAISEDIPSFLGAMENIFRAPLLSRHTLARISKECKTSLPGTQAVQLLRGILESMQKQVLALKEAQGEAEVTVQHQKKKLKSGRNSTGGSLVASLQQEQAAWHIYASVHVIQSILSGNKAVNMIGSDKEGFEELDTLASSIVMQTIHFHSISEKNTADQRIATAMLQLQGTWSLFAETDIQLEDEAGASLVRVLQTHTAASAELQFQVIRTLLTKAGSSDVDLLETGPLLDAVFAILNSAEDSTQHVWNGYTPNMSFADLPVAVWWLISSSYIDVVEQHATEQQLRSLVDFIFSHERANTPNEDGGISIPAATNRLLHSADFFELLRIRESVSTFVGELCDSMQLHQKHLEILLLLPTEYLDRSLRRKIVSTLISQQDSGGKHQSMLALLKFTKDDAGQPLVRKPSGEKIWLLQKLTEPVPQIKDTTFLLSLARQDKGETGALLSSLYEQLWRLMLQNWSASPESFAALPSFLESLTTSSSSGSKRLYLLTWRLIATEVKMSSVPANVLPHLQTQVHALQQYATSNEVSHAQLYHKLEACNTAQIVAEWTRSDAALSARGEYVEIAKDAISRLLQQDIVQEHEEHAMSAYMALELASMNVSSDLFDFETFVVTFWLLAQKLDLRDRRYSSLLARTASWQTEEAYKAAVSTVSEAVSSNVSDDAFAAALQVLSVLVCSPPDVATKIASQSFSASLRRISLLKKGLSMASAPPAVLRSITAYIKSFLEQKIGVPELQDVAVIWTILHDILTPDTAAVSSAPSPEPFATAIFLNVVDIMSLLATHRRDHIIPTFAQFARVLSDVIQLLRLSSVSASSNPKALWSTFPPWALAEHGRWMMESRCSKAVARLLVGLGTRTTVLQRSAVRARGASAGAVVALSGPLSKHAPFIMVNYLTAATDSRFPLSPFVRKEINAGILEVVGTMGKSEREALMKAYLQTDQEAERALLRVIWKEFDAVRYKGD